MKSELETKRRKRELKELDDYLQAIYFGREPGIPSEEENKSTIKSLRENWILLKKDENGILFQTPAGKYFLEENEDGSIKRLQLLNE